MQINLREAKESDVNIVNEHYKEIGFKESIYQNEIIVIAELKNNIVGLGRLQNLDGVSAELGGIYIRPEYRGKGLARKIVTHLLYLAKDYKKIYCIPFAHLENFYKSFGFTEVDKNCDIPKKISDKLNWCHDQYECDTLLLELDNK